MSNDCGGVISTKRDKWFHYLLEFLHVLCQTMRDWGMHLLGTALQSLHISNGMLYLTEADVMAGEPHVSWQ